MHGQASFENINIQNNTISTTDTNSDLELGTSGTGDVTVPGSNLAVTGNISVAGTTTLASLIATGNITANSLNVNTLSVNGAFQFENIQIDDNIISTTDTNSDLELKANGTGSVVYH